MKPTNRRWRVLGIRVSGNDMDRVEKAAEEAGETVSAWAKDAVLAKLGGNMGLTERAVVARLSPAQDLDLITCDYCHHTRSVRRKVVFNGPSAPGDDPGCQDRKCVAAAEAERRRLTPQETLETCLTIGTGFMSEFMKPTPAPDAPSLIRIEDISAEEFRKRYPDVETVPPLSPDTPSVTITQVMTQEEVERRYPHASLRNEGFPRYTLGGASTDPVSDTIEQLDRDLKAANPTYEPPGVSWSEEFSFMDAMGPENAMDHFRELIAGRKLPKGFTGWPRPQQIAWLDKEMPL